MTGAEGWLTLAQVCAVLGRSVRSVHRYADAGLIRSRLAQGRGRLYEAASVEALKASPPRRGRRASLPPEVRAACYRRAQRDVIESNRFAFDRMFDLYVREAERVAREAGTTSGSPAGTGDPTMINQEGR